MNKKLGKRLRKFIGRVEIIVVRYIIFLIILEVSKILII